MKGFKSVKVSVDLGNGFVKAICGETVIVKPSSVVLASSIAIDDEKLGHDYNLFSVNNSNFISGIAIEDSSFLVKADSLHSTYSKSQNRYSNKAFQNLFISTVAELLLDIEYDNEVIEVDVVTGVPSDDLNGKTKEVISNFLKDKTHIVTINKSKEIMFKVVEMAIMEQPLATLLNVAINDKLELDESIMNINNIIVDFGAGTTIIDTFFKAKRVSSESLTIYKGMKDIYESILNNLEDKGSLNNNDIEIALKNKEDIKIGRLHVKYDCLYNLFNQYATEFIDYTLITKLESFVNDNLRVNVYVTGGGSYLLRDLLNSTSLNEYISVVEDAQISGAQGMLKYNKLFL